MTKLRSMIVGAVSLVLAAAAMPQPAMSASSDIAAIVNGTIITSGDVAKRVAFLRLRRVGGNLQKTAKEELVNEVLEREEIIRTRNSVSTDEVDAAFERFAKSNKLTAAQLTEILSRSGVTAEHFKGYIGVQMSWPRAVQARYGNDGVKSETLADRIRKNGGKKPTTTEFFLQKVIFVVPESKRGSIMGKRKSEAEASRKRYPGCDQAKVFAATMRDVSIQNIGRVLAPALPDQWKDEIMNTQQGGTTSPQVGPNGVEYIAVCKRREVSDDLAAQTVYRAEDLKKAEKDGQDPNAKAYLEELRKKATIEVR